METTASMTEPRLREEDLRPGQAWIHPDSRLEYEDFHAYLCGKDPIPHWRNARIKELHAGQARWNEAAQGDREREAWSSFFARRCAYFFANFDHNGDSQFGIRSQYGARADSNILRDHLDDARTVLAALAGV